MLVASERSEFAVYLRSLRKRREMTLRDLGESAGIDFTYLSKIENDQVSVPSVDAIHRLARALQATPAEVGTLIRTSDEHRENKVEIPTKQTPEEAMLLRRIYSGGYTRSQLRRMLQSAEPKDRATR
jgi:transcriptional regulator with XRE-family HTH domain